MRPLYACRNKIAILETMLGQEAGLTASEISFASHVEERNTRRCLDVMKAEGLVTGAKSYWDGKFRWQITLTGRVRLQVANAVKASC